MKYILMIALALGVCQVALTAHQTPQEPLYNLVWDHSGQRFILDHDLTLEDCSSMMQARMGCEMMGK